MTAPPQHDRVHGWGQQPPTEDRERKHRLVEDVKHLVDRVAMLAAEEADAGAVEEVRSLLSTAVARLDTQPMLHNGAAASGSPDAALFERSPIAGRSNPIAPPLRLWTDGDVVRGEAVYGRVYEGPPGTLHGAFVAAAFDEVLGFAQHLSGSGGMTGTLTVRFLRPTPLGRRIDYEGGVDRVEGRKIFTWARSSSDGEVVSEAEGIFIARRS